MPSMLDFICLIIKILNEKGRDTVCTYPASISIAAG